MATCSSTPEGAALEIIVLNNREQIADLAARRLRELLRVKPKAVLGLATGATPLDLYRRLITDFQQARLSFREATSFNLDEYVGLPADDLQSYRSYMQRELFDAVDIDPNNTFLPSCGIDEDPLDAGPRYDRLIHSKGGIDVQLLGIGENGHIGFNEPTSSLGSRTRVKTLSPQTLRSNSRYFGHSDRQPQLAITMGIATILEAREILLLAVGQSKATAVRQAVEGPVSAMCPASALQMHAKVVVLLDQAAASELALREYYDWVYEQKQRLESKLENR